MATSSTPAVPAPRDPAVQGGWLNRSRTRPADGGPAEVSVCIANWNCRDLLRGCLQSLLDGTQGVRVEVIVADNGSADGAADMVTREFPEVVLVRNDSNLGFARASNQAAYLARGSHLFFLNNDTLVPPGTLRRLLDFAEAHPEAGMVGPRLRDTQGRFQVSYRCRPSLATLLHRTALLRWTGLLRPAYRRYRRQEFDPNTTRRVEVLMGAAVLLRREQFRAWGGWDEEFPFGGEDLELSARVGREAALVYYPGAEVVHFGRASTRQHIGHAYPRIMAGFVRYLRKTGASPLGLFVYKAVVTLDTPLQLLLKCVEYLLRRLRGRAGADKSMVAVRGLAAFLTRGLLEFWGA